jgi:hypothetical protein
MVVAIVAVSCTGTATVTETAGGQDAGAEAATPRPTSPQAEPTPGASTGPEPTASVEATPAPEPTPEPTTVPTLPAETFRPDNVVAISADGDYGYAAITRYWEAETPCDAEPIEQVIGLPLANAEADPQPFSAGIAHAGDIDRLLIDQGRFAAIARCANPTTEDQLQVIAGRVESDGRFTIETERSLGAIEDNRSPWFTQLADGQLSYRLLREVDPDDWDTWQWEFRTLDIETGEDELLATSSYDDLGPWPEPLLETSDGFVYRETLDPNGAVGCEGFGVATTIEVEANGQSTLALGRAGLTFSSVANMQINDDGYVFWTSSCEGYDSAYVGQMRSDGTIVDAHFISTSDSEGSFAEYRNYRLTNDGYVRAVGNRVVYDDSGPDSLAVLNYDLSTDPHFINDVPNPPLIDAGPLIAGLDPTTGWHVGESLAADPACGGSTLYGEVDGEFFRAFETGTEIGHIVDADVSVVVESEGFEEGSVYRSRWIAISVQCPDEYEGRKIWFGVEGQAMRWGLFLSPAALDPVAEVRDLRVSLDASGNFVESVLVEVVQLDGTIAEVRLE